MGNLSEYERYCCRLMEEEKNRYEEYFHNVMSVVHEQYDEGMMFINECYCRLKESFAERRFFVKNFKDELKRDYVKVKNVEKKIR